MRSASPGGPFSNPARPVTDDSSALLWNLPLALTVLLIMNHFGRPFEKFLTGYKIPLVMCLLGILVAFFGRGLRVLKSPIGLTLCWMLGWMAICVPFSFWKMGSARYIMNYAALWAVFLALIATAPRTLRDLKRIATAILIACSFYILVGLRWGAGQRLELSGTFGNSDDVALLAGFTIPFVVFFASQIRSFVLKACVLAVSSGFLIWTIGYTGTRAAIPALGCMFLVYLIRGSAVQRAALAALSVGAVLIAVTILPDTIIKRFATIFSAMNSERVYAESGSDEAMASVAQRSELLRDALRAGSDHVIVGVGPGQFVNYRFERIKGFNGLNKPYLPSHNTYLQFFSEEGLPGVILYVIFLAMIYRTVRRVRKLNAPGSHPDWNFGLQLAICLEAALIYFAACAAFMTCDQHPHQFAIAGLALGLERITRTRIQMFTSASRPAKPGLSAPGRSFAPAFSGPALAGHIMPPSPSRRVP